MSHHATNRLTSAFALAIAMMLVTAIAGCDSSGVTAPAEAKLIDPPPSDSSGSAPVVDNLPADVAADLPAEQGADESGETEAAPAPEDTQRLRETTFDDIKFDIEPDQGFERSMLTEQIEALDGKKIRIRGYILPTAQRSGLKSFVLVRDNKECCFGPGAALYDCILVKMLPEKSARFSIYPVSVAGTFRIEEFKGLDGRHLAVFQIDGENVE